MNNDVYHPHFPRPPARTPHSPACARPCPPVPAAAKLPWGKRGVCVRGGGGVRGGRVEGCEGGG